MPEQPTPPQFNRWSRLEEITQQIAGQISVLLGQAHAEGCRDGIEIAAQMCDASADWIRGLPEINDGHLLQIAMAEFLRDQIRLMAHQIPDAEVPNGS